MLNGDKRPFNDDGETGLASSARDRIDSLVSAARNAPNVTLASVSVGLGITVALSFLFQISFFPAMGLFIVITAALFVAMMPLE